MQHPSFHNDNVELISFSISLPGHCRGFAFVDFLSHQEAVNAMDSVAGTHLYGRRLVTEWAAQDESLDELRTKTAAKFQDIIE